MSKTITIDDDVYKLLSSLKNGSGELLDAYKFEPPPKVDHEMLTRLLRERGRRAGVRN
jgi:hypothetical protein